MGCENGKCVRRATCACGGRQRARDPMDPGLRAACRHHSPFVLFQSLPPLPCLGSWAGPGRITRFCARNRVALWVLDENFLFNICKTTDCFKKWQKVLLLTHTKCGEISSAEQVFGVMIEKNTVSYTTMISGLGQHGFGRRALSLFYSMQEKGLKPDAVTFLAAISACNYSGLVEEGLALYRSMETFGLAATPQHHCCIVDMLGKAGRVEEAYDFVEELGDQSNFVSIWGSLLASCKAQGKQELAKLVTERLLCIEKKYGHAGYNVLLSHIFSAESNWSSADSLRKEMRLRGLRKVAGSSWIRVQDAALQNYPKNGQIYSMLQGVNYSSDEII